VEGAGDTGGDGIGGGGGGLSAQELRRKQMNMLAECGLNAVCVCIVYVCVQVICVFSCVCRSNGILRAILCVYFVYI
jgi:hypothetical protein